MAKLMIRFLERFFFMCLSFCVFCVKIHVLTLWVLCINYTNLSIGMTLHIINNKYQLLSKILLIKSLNV